MQNVENKDSDVVEIDLMEVIGLLLNKAWLILLCALVAGTAGFLISKFLLTEQYQSTTRIYVLNRQNDNTLTYSDVQLGTQLTKDFTEIVKSRYVLERVIATCGLGESTGKLSSRIDVETKSDTRIIAITVTDENPETARYVADEVRKEAADRIKSVMDIEAVNVVDEANLPEAPSTPDKRKWALVGALIGAFLCVAGILAHFMLDDTVKTSEDVEKYLGLSTLGMIPTRESADKKHKREKSPKRRRHGTRWDTANAGHAYGMRHQEDVEQVSEQVGAAEETAGLDEGQNETIEKEIP